MSHETDALLRRRDDSSLSHHPAPRGPFVRAVVLAVGALVLSAVLYATAATPSSWKKTVKILGHTHSSSDPLSILFDETLDGKELFYEQQTLDHLSNDEDAKKTWSHRYYKISKHFRGPGHPIIMVIGGEDALTGPLHPFIEEGMASKFGAFVIEPEHRFYGKSTPVENASVHDYIKYLSPDQALLDAIQLLQTTRQTLGCSLDRSSPFYCPAISVGASYPGFLSAMLRYVYADFVDMSFAASAPIRLYSQTNDANAYYDKVSEVAEQMSPGCANAVRSTMEAVQDTVLSSNWTVSEAAANLGFCPNDLPEYIQDLDTLVSEGVVYMLPAIFADFNMFSYPPGPQTPNVMACNVFQNDNLTPLEKIQGFFELRGLVEYGETVECFDLGLELPTGPNARIMGSDWSGSGGGKTGEIWEFQCCKDLIIRSGYSNTSMFIPREWTYEWHDEHCRQRFPGITLNSFRLEQKWHFDQLAGASRIVFTNGMNDGWSAAGSFLEDVNDSVVAITIADGAHHSDLGGKYPDEKDTDAVKEAQVQVMSILEQWLEEIYATQSYNI
ncbi:dipeptidyl-peptidase II [Fistulifera solaris]|uniref:Dipeptidyl-peptidase II n=1 Tax=Fistulifera solaris TaxID=1519565 RepID=A0A1Z5KSD7_FISSO|nr:dipeptidyl-peptidase II [Fistulifera solaris]|eukprot:GAX29234.1 dipeptidyl-peptidase II [Fistulifera solaris]